MKNGENKRFKVISGSFLKGCGVVVWDLETDKIYHTLVLRNKETGLLFAEISGKVHYKEEFSCKTQ